MVVENQSRLPHEVHEPRSSSTHLAYKLEHVVDTGRVIVAAPIHAIDEKRYNNARFLTGGGGAQFSPILVLLRRQKILAMWLTKAISHARV